MARKSKRLSILNEIKKIPCKQPIAGVEHGYFWEVAGGKFRFSLVVLPDLEHIIQMNTREKHDERLILDTLTTALTHCGEIVNSKSCSVIPNFRSPPYSFDEVVSLSPRIHPVHVVEYPPLHEVTYAVFPAFQCEFSGSESDDELRLLYSKLVTPADVRRTPKPIVRIRFKNSRTGARSIGSRLGLTTFDSLTVQLRELARSPASFVEFENFQKSRVRVVWNDAYIWEDETGKCKLSSKKIVERAKLKVLYG